MADRIVLNTISYHGHGAIENIVPELTARGFKKAFLTSDADLVKFGVTAKVTNLLDKAGFAYTVYSDIKPNPTIENVKNGVKVTYYYNKAGFSFPVEYTLEEDCLKASLKVSDIKEPKDEKIATEVTLMSSFGVASDTEDGCFVIPDGSGALVRFNNNKTMDTNAYTQRVYGNDITAVRSAE